MSGSAKANPTFFKATLVNQKPLVNYFDLQLLFKM